jgi:hypothetical protein
VNASINYSITHQTTRLFEFAAKFGMLLPKTLGMIKLVVIGDYSVGPMFPPQCSRSPPTLGAGRTIPGRTVRSLSTTLENCFRPGEMTHSESAVKK